MDKKNAAVIGSGFGGIAAAIRLQSAGIQTTLFEKRDKPGGRAYVFEDNGFRFDAGPTVITAPNSIRELFELAGKKMEDYVELISVNPFYRLHFNDGTHFDYSNDEEKLISQIKSHCQEDVDGYRRFLKYSEAVFNEGYTRLVHVPFQSFWDMVKVAPKLIRLRADRSVYSTVSRFIRNENLRQGFSFHSLLIGGNPFSASSIYTLIHFLERNWGVYFPRGGTGALVRGLLELFTDLGGELRLNEPISRIITEHDRVTGIATQKGYHRCSFVVSNAEGFHTYSLMPENATAQSRAKALSRKRYSMSLFLIYLGLDRLYDLAHHNVIFGPRYRELLDDIFEKGILADDFSLYLHNPCITDPSLAPQGSSAIYVLSPVPHLEKFKTDWNETGPKYADRIIQFLEKHQLPDLSKHIVYRRLFTPSDFKTELNAYQGSAFSLEPTLYQSAYFRMKNRDPKIQGLYFVGAGTHPGAGVPGVINSAKATCGLIMGSTPLNNYTQPMLSPIEVRV